MVSGRRVANVGILLLFLIVFAFPPVLGQDTASAGGRDPLVFIKALNLVKPDLIKKPGPDNITRDVPPDTPHTNGFRVGEDIKSLNILQTWTTPSVDLDLEIFSPDGTSWGKYYDIIDGSIDQTIPLVLYADDGSMLEQGTWIFKTSRISTATGGSYTLMVTSGD